jgi:2Fe-2S ferredoxin
MRIYCTTEDGERHELDAIEGWRVMEIIRDHGLPIKAECGGALACATCHVYVAPEWQDKLYPPSLDEIDMLDMAIAVQDNSRLSCQIIMSEELDGLEVTLGPMP